LFLELAQMRLPVGQTLLAPHELCQLLVDLLLLREDTLLDLDNPRAVLCNLVVDLRAELDRLFTRADLGFASKVLDFAPSLVEELTALLPRGPEPRLPECTDRDSPSESPDDETDEYPDGNEHEQLLGRLSATHRGAHPAVGPARGVPNR